MNYAFRPCYLPITFPKSLKITAFIFKFIRTLKISRYSLNAQHLETQEIAKVELLRSHGGNKYRALSNCHEEALRHAKSTERLVPPYFPISYLPTVVSATRRKNAFAKCVAGPVLCTSLEGMQSELTAIL